MRDGRQFRKRAGYGFLELLLAMGLVSFGLLGMIHLQNDLLKADEELLHRIQANLMFYDFLRWADTANNVLEGVSGSDYRNIPEASDDCVVTACSQPERTRFFLRHWKCRLGTWVDNPACSDINRPMLVLRQGDARLVAQGHSLQLSIKWQDLEGGEQTLHRNLVITP